MRRRPKVHPGASVALRATGLSSVRTPPKRQKTTRRWVEPVCLIQRSGHSHQKHLQASEPLEKRASWCQRCAPGNWLIKRDAAGQEEVRECHPVQHGGRSTCYNRQLRLSRRKLRGASVVPQATGLSSGMPRLNPSTMRCVLPDPLTGAILRVFDLGTRDPTEESFVVPTVCTRQLAHQA